ncbi:MAG: hypothetical protein ABJA66_03665 [Actinomycetota bacterium]
MTSYRTIERQLAPFKNTLSKLAPHQTEEILLVFNMAAIALFRSENPSLQIIERLGHEEALKLTIDEFLAKVEAEMPPKKPMTSEQTRNSIYAICPEKPIKRIKISNADSDTPTPKKGVRGIDSDPIL